MLALYTEGGQPLVVQGTCTGCVMLRSAKASVVLAEEFDHVICQNLRLLHCRKMPSCTCAVTLMKRSKPARAQPGCSP